MRYLCIALLILLNGCSSEPEVSYDGADLLEKKCSSCHDLNMPPKLSVDDKAPPMMAVAFHVKDFMKVKVPSEKKAKFIAFYQDYSLNPAAEKSFCDKESIKKYGLMPSQKGQATVEELGAIAEYVYKHYDQEKFMTDLQAKANFEALPKGEQLATRNGCLNCHDKKKPKTGPSFSNIAKKEKSEIEKIIKNGSKGKWKGFEKAMMPSYKKLSDLEIDTLSNWIKTL